MLSAGKNQLEQFGITSPVHVSRAETCIAQLHVHQSKLDNELMQHNVQQKAEKVYFDVEEQYRQSLLKESPYRLPTKMDHWKTIDVFAFCQHPKYQEALAPFVKALALRKITGKELLEISKIPASTATVSLIFVICLVNGIIVFDYS